MEEEAKKDIPLDFYLILGIKSSDAASDIKKAYRKVAPEHHPDKAGQFLARSESGDEGQLWKTKSPRRLTRMLISFF
jgi:DnaJ family protein C protein 7